MYLPPAAAPARVDHPRAVGKLDDLALVAVLGRLAERLPRLAVVFRAEERIAVAHVDDRVEERAVLRLHAGAGRHEDEAARVVSLAERPLGERDVLRDVAGLRPRLAVVGGLLHVEPVYVAPPVGAVGVLPVPDIVEKEYLLRLRVDDERRVAAAPLVAVGPRPVPGRRAFRPRAPAVRRAAAYDVDRLERVQVAAVEAPCVAHYDKVAVGRGAEGGNAVDGGFHSFDNIVALEEDLLADRRLARVAELVKLKALRRARPDGRLHVGEELDVRIDRLAARRKREAVRHDLGVDGKDRVVVSGEAALLGGHPVAAYGLHEKVDEVRAAKLSARLWTAAKVLDEAVDAPDRRVPFRLERAERRHLEPRAVAPDVARKRGAVVAVLAHVDGEAARLADLPVERHHGLPARPLAAEALDRHACARVQVLCADVLGHLVWMGAEVERVAWIPDGEYRDLSSVKKLLYP